MTPSKRPAHRPPDGDVARASYVTIRTTAAEREALHDAAESAGLMLSDYVRRMPDARMWIVTAVETFSGGRRRSTHRIATYATSADVAIRKATAAYPELTHAALAADPAPDGIRLSISPLDTAVPCG